MCVAGVEAALNAIGGDELKTAEGAAKAAKEIIEALNHLGLHLPEEELIKLILDNIADGVHKVAELICKKVGACS